MAIRWTNTCNL